MIISMKFLLLFLQVSASGYDIHISAAGGSLLSLANGGRQMDLCGYIS
jgi:hypothetical protein